MIATEAINKIQYRINTANKMVGCGENLDEFEDLEMAIKALNKQVLIKIQKFKDTDSYCCPCGYCVGKPFVNQFYCIRCGQALTK